MKTKQTSSNRSLLKKGLLCLIMVASCISTVFTVQHFSQHFEQQVRQQKRQLDTSRQRYNGAKNNLQIKEQYLARYNSLRERQLIGPIDRLLWVDGLVELEKELALVDMSIHFSAQEKLSQKVKQQLNVKNPIYQRFGLSLEFSMQHEGDFLQLMAAINKHISPVYFIDQCEFGRIDENATIPVYKPESGNFKVKCELLMIQTLPREMNS